jgi:hypothetical protein
LPLIEQLNDLPWCFTLGFVVAIDTVLGVEAWVLPDMFDIDYWLGS